MTVELLLHIPDTELGEGPVWDPRTQMLWWVDILKGRLHGLDPATDTTQTYEMGQYLGAAVPRESGGFMLALQRGLATYDPGSNTLKMLHDPEPDKPENRFNDGKVDPAGRFWAGTMEIDPQNPNGSLYCLHPGTNKVEVKRTGVYISNGLAWTQDQQTFYYIDSLTFKLVAFDYEVSTGVISGERDAIVFDRDLGTPDGMAIDKDDNLWIAFYEGAKIACFDPRTGKQLDQVDVPAHRTTSCAFGGENLDTLYITSAAKGGDPFGGGLFIAQPGVSGPPITYYKG